MRFFDVLKAEAKLIFSDVAIVLTIIGGVILYSFLYPQPYAQESVSALPLAVVDLDKSDTSRAIIFKLNATPQIEIVREDMSREEALKALESTAVKAIAIIPAHFKRDLLLQKRPTIAVGVDNSYFLIYGAVLEAAMKAVLTESAEIKIAGLLQEQLPMSGALRAYEPYTVNTINLFNAQNSYTQYVVPAVFVLILQQTLLIGMGILGGGVNEKRKKGESLHYKDAAISQVFFSRFLLFGSLFLLHMLFYFEFSFENFSITHLAKPAELISFGLLFLSAVMALGLFLGSLLRSREIATPLVLFSSLPLVFSVGFIWPLEAIPPFIHTIALFIPSTAGIDGFLSLNQMGASLGTLSTETTILLLQTIFYTLMAYIVEKRRKNNANNYGIIT
jgi:ABC-2 type transport system permease protein